MKYGYRSRAAKRGFGSDAEQGTSTKVSFDYALKQRAFKDSVDCDLAMKLKQIKIPPTPTIGFNAIDVSHIVGGSFAGNDENIASIPQALPWNGLSSGTSDSAEFLKLLGDAPSEF